MNDSPRSDSFHALLRASRALCLPAGFALIQLLAGPALAQGTGEADPAQSKARPTARTTPEERSAARTDRMAEGAQAARGPQMGEAERRPTTAPRVSSAERKAANARRIAENRKANKSGEFARGGNADAPERARR